MNSWEFTCYERRIMISDWRVSIRIDWNSEQKLQGIRACSLSAPFCGVLPMYQLQSVSQFLTFSTFNISKVLPHSTICKGPRLFASCVLVETKNILSYFLSHFHDLLRDRRWVGNWRMLVDFFLNAFSFWLMENSNL